MSQVALKDIANIRSGYTFRGKAQAKRGSGIHMLQIRDLKDNFEIESRELLEIDWSGNNRMPTIEHHEIAIIARGSTNNAALMKGDSKVIPSNQLLIVTIKSEQVIPAYVCWWLNRPTTQNKLAELHVGTSIPSLSKKELLGLDIFLPDTRTQQQVIRLSQLQLQEKALYERLLKNREIMLEGLFQQLLVNGETK
jgi:restriction endonuclease S subunit